MIQQIALILVGQVLKKVGSSCNEGKELARISFPTQISVMLADEQTTPEQFAIYRRMTPERRLALAEGLCWTARRMKAAWLRSLHPDWSEAQVTQEVARIFSNARS